MTSVCSPDMHVCMRTTMNLPDSLLERARKAAAEEDTTVTQLVREGLQERLSRRIKRSRAGKKRYKLTTFGRGGVRPGVDLNKTSSLLDAMDADDFARR